MWTLSGKGSLALQPGLFTWCYKNDEISALAAGWDLVEDTADLLDSIEADGEGWISGGVIPQEV